MSSRRGIIPGVLLLIILQASSLGAAEWGKYYPDHLWRGARNSFDDPHWLFAAGAIAGLSAWDQEVRTACRQRILPEPLAKVGQYYGFGTSYLAGAVFILSDGFGSCSQNHQERLDSWQTFSEAYLLTIAGTGAIKLVTHRLRPDGSSHDSFPSGHASASACTAAHLGSRYGHRAGIPSTALALVTSLSRIHHDRHWFSDVLAGALLGGLVGNGFGQLRRAAGAPSRTADFHIQINIIFVF